MGRVRVRLVSVQPELAEATTAGAQVMLGGKELPTRTSWRQVLLLPLTSTAVQVTKLVPNGKNPGALLVRLAMAQLSPASAVPKSTWEAPFVPGSLRTLRSAGQSMTGSWSSTTVTVNVQVLELLQPSVATLVTMVLPVWNE